MYVFACVYMSMLPANIYTWRSATVAVKNAATAWRIMPPFSCSASATPEAYRAGQSQQAGARAGERSAHPQETLSDGLVDTWRVPELFVQGLLEGGNRVYLRRVPMRGDHLRQNLGVYRFL